MAYLSLAQATAAVTAAEEAVTEAKKSAHVAVVRELRRGKQPVELAKPASPWTASHIRTVANDNGIELMRSKNRFTTTPAAAPKPAAADAEVEQPPAGDEPSLAQATAAVAEAEGALAAAKELATDAVVRELRRGKQPVDLAHPNSPWSATHIRGIAGDHGIKLQESKVRSGPRGPYKKKLRPAPEGQ